MFVCLVCNTAVGAGKRKYLDVSTEPLLSIRELLVWSQDEEEVNAFLGLSYHSCLSHYDFHEQHLLPYYLET